MGKTFEYQAKFIQHDPEEFHKCWEDFNDLLRRCPHHKIMKWNMIHIFFHGLNSTQQSALNFSSGDSFLKLYEDAS